MDWKEANEAVQRAAEAGDELGAWEALAPLERVLETDEAAAWGLATALEAWPGRIEIDPDFALLHLRRDAIRSHPPDFGCYRQPNARRLAVKPSPQSGLRFLLAAALALSLLVFLLRHRDPAPVASQPPAKPEPRAAARIPLSDPRPGRTRTESPPVDEQARLRTAFNASVAALSAQEPAPATESISPGRAAVNDRMQSAIPPLMSCVNSVGQGEYVSGTLELTMTVGPSGLVDAWIESPEGGLSPAFVTCAGDAVWSVDWPPVSPEETFTIPMGVRGRGAPP